ncbi:MAG: HAMP domain-containing histidine kinase [Anaerolineae bacterium]|nr:HAMP domain-containing histidine kinase [Anaerolineae bacterium]
MVVAQQILVVEDHLTLLEAIQSILQLEGYVVAVARNGVEALEVMEKAYPDLILADIMMPQMDGFSFFEAVRARPEWVRIPFIFLTARAEKEDILRGKGLGVEDYITKPFSTEELLVAVRARLDRAKVIQEASTVEFDRLKQQIITSLSHELRTPLTYVIGYTDLALEGVASMSPEVMEEFLLGIKRGGDRLTRVVADLLWLTRLDSGRAVEEYRLTARRHADLDVLLRQTIEKREKAASERGVTLQLEIEPGLPPVALCEPFFVDALDRLVDNGIRFTRAEGKSVTVRAHSDNGYVLIDVKDEGIGIPPAEISHIFERLHQVDRDKLEQQGVGLGLVIAQGLIHLHGGRITVESQHGVGSRFTICLPALSEGEKLSQTNGLGR